MPKNSLAADGADSVIEALMTATRQSGDQAQQAWARSCDIYSNYYAALARADGLEAVYAANAKLMNEGVSAILQTAATWPAAKPNGAAG